MIHRLNKERETCDLICPLSSRQVKYLNEVLKNDRTKCAVVFYAHHLALYFSIRLFRGIKYSVACSAENASVLTSSGVLQ